MLFSVDLKKKIGYPRNPVENFAQIFLRGKIVQEVCLFPRTLPQNW
jgi:hypothetical protein